MACEPWTEKLDAYLDGELPADEARGLDEHLRRCASCTAESLDKLQQRRAVHAASLRFVPDPAFRARIQRSTSALLLTFDHVRSGDEQLMSELVDLHVSTLASPNPVDVVSSDRHTVKPWFEGKIPFTFNLPELQNSPFVLVGGRVIYLHQSPGAELVFRVRQHQISVFLFQEQGLRELRGHEAVRTDLSFEVRTWRHHGLRYIVIGDASAQDLDTLSKLLEASD